MKIAIIVLNWNGKTLLEQFLPSVVANSQDADIYVADNASTDDSVQFVQKHYPNVHIIQNKENGGFAKGYNDALKHVNADILCLLNSDVEVTPNWLEPIKQTFQDAPKTAIVQPKILDYKQKDRFEYAGAAGGFIDKYGYPFCRGRIFTTLEKDQGQYNDCSEVFWASGACLFIRKEVFFKANGFDESFFAHMEEIDLCWRVQNLGFKVMYQGASTVYHVGGATLKASNPKKTFLNFRNSLFTLIKNSKSPVFGIILVRLILDGLAAIQFLTQLKFSHIFAILKAHFSFYGHLPSLVKQRKHLQQKVKHYKISSVVWAYFISRNHTYRQLGNGV
ncbi:glycosyltransferase family 2 protein [Mangrovimonas aestuarii]|uniref:glycosyltransferase family 2 protein n=1 Tax=Mangrovimonas aestuarii TaxID=3018443 RepID=UPI002378087B|nr:glycosyltransferase family 2 protein [Mangrovimonas aestuarii]